MEGRDKVGEGVFGQRQTWVCSKDGCEGESGGMVGAGEEVGRADFEAKYGRKPQGGLSEDLLTHEVRQLRQAVEQGNRDACFEAMQRGSGCTVVVDKV